MRDFFKSMFSNGDEVSSKRFSAFFTLFNIIVLTYVATFMSEDKVTPEFMFDALALIAGGGLGLTVIEKIFNKNKSSNPQKPDLSVTQDTTPEAQQSDTIQCSCGSPNQPCDKCR